MGPRKLEGKSRVCNQPEAPALQSSVPCYWKVQGDNPGGQTPARGRSTAAAQSQDWFCSTS